MNKTQKVILSIVVILVLFLLTNYFEPFIKRQKPIAHDTEHTCYWIGYIIIVGAFNFWLFSNKMDKDKKKNEES